MSRRVLGTLTPTGSAGNDGNYAGFGPFLTTDAASRGAGTRVESWIGARNEGSMEHALHCTLSLLSHTPAALDALLRELPQEWTLRNEGQNTWTVFDVVGHLIHV